MGLLWPLHLFLALQHWPKYLWMPKSMYKISFTYSINTQNRCKRPFLSIWGKYILTFVIQNDMNYQWKNFGRQMKNQICYENNVIVLKPNTSWNLFNIFSKDFAACLVIQSPLFWGWRALFSTSMSLVEKDLFVQKLFSLGWFFEKAAALPLEIFRQTNRS